MPSSPKITMYDKPRVMYLRRQEPGSRAFEVEMHGETSRSWVEGEFEWGHTKYPFSKYEQVSREEYELDAWASRNMHAISRRVGDWTLPPATLRKVADLIGYEEKSNG